MLLPVAAAGDEFMKSRALGLVLHNRKQSLQTGPNRAVHAPLMMTRHLLSLLLSLPVFALVGSGCASDTRGGEDDVDSEINAVEDGHEFAPGAPPPMGPHALFFAALTDPAVSPEKRAEIQAALEAARPPSSEEERHELRAKALAEAVRSGAVDVAKLQPSAAEIEAHERNVHARLSSALTTLHGILDAKEREAVVARVRDHKPGRSGDRAPHGPPPGDHLEMLLRGVSLDAAQRTKIEAALEDAGLGGPPPAPPAPPEPAALAAFLDSFTSDSFDASTLPAPPRMRPPPMLEALAVVAPLLDPEQRDALAARILQGPPRPPARR